MNAFPWLTSFLNQPSRVLVTSIFVGSLFMFYDGSFWNLWSLHRNQKEMLKRIEAIQEDTKSLQFRVVQSQQSSFIERQATEQLGLVREDDLVFVFSETD